MMVTDQVLLALKALTLEDVRPPARVGHFGLKQIVRRWMKDRGETKLVEGDVALVESTLLRLEQFGVVRRCENDMWRLT